MRGLKRKVGQGPGQRGWQSGKGQKGKGKKGDNGGKGPKGGKAGKGGMQAVGIPQNTKDLRSIYMKTFNGENCCWDFHLPGGCSLAQPGAWCVRGWHLCNKCGKAHSIQVPCP